MVQLKLVQLALTTRDLPAALRFHAEIFGFSNAGGLPIWGSPMHLQGLDSSARAMMWWLLDGQDFFQIEIFAHSEPFPKNKAEDWRPNDLGWVRFGIYAPSVDTVKQALSTWSVSLKGERRDASGSHRIVFTDPTTSAMIEVIENDAVERCTVAYATYSTADIEASRRFYGETLNLSLLDRNLLHLGGDEALWGLEGAETEGFIVGTKGPWIEIVQYRAPPGRPKPANAQIADLGIMNVALGAADEDVVREMITRVQAAGYSTTPIFGDGGSVVTYLTEPGSEIELIAVPEQAAAQWGFRPIAPFLGTMAQGN
nr:VOC family protein [Sphingomonas sp. CDS-1]